MADEQADASTRPELIDGEESLLSTLDIFLFSLIAGLIIYWVMFRKKPVTIPDFQKLDTP